MSNRKNINPYYGKINPYEPGEDDLDITKIQSYLAEDVYVDLVEREWKHRRRETTPEGDVVKVDLHDGSTTELKVLGDYDKQQGYHDGFQASLYYDKENNRLHFAIRGTEADRETFQDVVKTDGFGIALTRHNPQIDDTIRFVRDVVLPKAQEIGINTGNYPEIYATGHSLGGNDVQAVKFFFGDRITRADAFNPQSSANLSGWQHISPKADVPDMINHCRSGDKLCASSRQIGETRVYTLEGDLEHIRKAGLLGRLFGNAGDYHAMYGITGSKDGNGVMTDPKAAFQRTNDNIELIERYRDTVRHTRDAVSVITLFSRVRDIPYMFDSRYPGQMADKAGIAKYPPAETEYAPEAAQKPNSAGKQAAAQPRPEYADYWHYQQLPEAAQQLYRDSRWLADGLMAKTGREPLPEAQADSLAMKLAAEGFKLGMDGAKGISKTRDDAHISISQYDGKTGKQIQAETDYQKALKTEPMESLNEIKQHERQMQAAERQTALEQQRQQEQQRKAEHEQTVLQQQERERQNDTRQNIRNSGMDTPAFDFGM